MFNPTSYGKQKPLLTLDAQIAAANALQADFHKLEDKLANAKAKVAGLQTDVSRLSTSPGYVSSLTEAQRRAKPNELTDALIAQQQAQDERDAFAKEHGDLASQIANLQAEKTAAGKAEASSAAGDILKLLAVAMENVKGLYDQYRDAYITARRAWPTDTPVNPIHIAMFDEPGDPNSWESMKLALISIDTSIVPEDDGAHAKLARLKQQQADTRAIMGLRY